MSRITPQFRSVIRFLRLALGLVVACVFAGRVEAATQHCVRLAHEATISAEAPMLEAAACHMTGTEKPAKAPAHHAASMAACECIAFAKSVSTPVPVLATTRIAAFVWERPQVEAFASLDLIPEGPPPKA